MSLPQNNNPKKIGVILSGCGRADGSEIQESVLTLLRISQNGCLYQCISFDMDQVEVINHLTRKPIDKEHRNQLVESARIARGDVKNITEISADDLDAVVLPGGAGWYKNMCKGNEGVNSDLKSLIEEMFRQHKPIGAICISPLLIARILGKYKIKLTAGLDNKEDADKIIMFGAEHIDCGPHDCVIDEKNKILSTPAYMVSNVTIGDISKGIFILIDNLVKMI
ncbi:isoprenoid biosynthesis glyoxalase ElbB [Candidatus Dependentiae bacterium]|nr:isoprenoid biosynthesis glyoxalase ElbB [Candidatus Dependentiae bacterium]